jgi:tetratricopeptide (TPR) repeat protein
MNNKFEQAKSLASQGKYKKALFIVKKINMKSAQVNITSLELEAACLFHEKCYQLAELKMEQVLALSTVPKHRFECLNNLASISEKQGKLKPAINYLKASLDIDGSLNSADKRYALVKLGFSVKDYNTVEEYGPLLKNISQYSIDILLMLAQVAINTEKQTLALPYLNQLATDIKTQSRTIVPQQSIVGALNGFHSIGAYGKEQQLLTFLAPKFNHEKWFTDILLRSEAVAKKGKNSKKDIENYKVKKESALNNVTDGLVENSRKPVLAANQISHDMVTGTNPQAVRAIIRLKREMERMGAAFNKHMSIVEENGEVVVKCVAALSHPELLMDVPLQCMPLVNDYKFSLDNNQLIVTAKKNQLNPHANKIMILLADMYNACNKLAEWKASFPLFAMAGSKELFDKFLQARSNSAKYLDFYADSIDQLTADIVIKSFIGSRVLSFQNDELRKLGAKTKNLFESGFIPIVDLINHKMGATGFQRNIKKLRLQTIIEPGAADREVFVQYNLDDPLITLLMYGFVDDSATWIYTVPVILKTKTGLTVQIENLGGPTNIEQVPNHLSGYCDYFPTNISRNGNVVNVSKLIIPSKEHINSLRLMITHVLESIDIEGIYKNIKNLQVEVDFFEKQLIEYNIHYWQELQLIVETHIESNKQISMLTLEQLQELCTFCLKHIRYYQSNSGNMLKQ